MAAHGIRTGMKLKQSLPKVPLDLQFGRALTDVIDFSQALLSKGGELNIEAGVCRQDGENYIELNIVSSSDTSLQVEEGDVFRPFANVNGHRAGLSMAVAQQILKAPFRQNRFSQRTIESRRILSVDPCAQHRRSRVKELDYAISRNRQISNCRVGRWFGQIAGRQILPVQPSSAISSLIPNVLVVDDDATIRSQLVRLYSHSGYTVVPVSSAEDALTQLARRQY